MTKEEILEKAKKNPDNELENAVTDRGTILGVALGAIFTVILVVIKYIITKKTDSGIMAVMTFIAGVEYFYKGRFLGIKKNVVEGILWLVVSAICTAVYIGGML